VQAQWCNPFRCRVYADDAHGVGRAAERRWAWSLRGARSECYVKVSPGMLTSFFAAMAHDKVLDWMVTHPPPCQTAVDFSDFVTNVFLLRMSSVEEGLAWKDQLDIYVLVLDNARFTMRFLLMCCAAQFNAWSMLTIDTMMLYITGRMCREFLRAATRRYRLYVP